VPLLRKAAKTAYRFGQVNGTFAAYCQPHVMTAVEAESGLQFYRRVGAAVARDIKPGDLDPGWLVWAIHRRLNLKAMPAGRTVIEIEFIDAPANHRRFWLVHADGAVDVRLKDPGHEVTLRVAAPLLAFAEVWRGLRPLRDALAAGTIRLSGPPQHCRALPGWLLLSAYAPIKREPRARIHAT
jgi:hypothetical protein